MVAGSSFMTSTNTSSKAATVVRFPSSEQAKAFYASAEYQEVLKISKESARRTVVLVEGF